MSTATAPAKKNVCSKQAAGSQLARLSSIPKWLPQAKEGQDEIVKALRKYCKSDQHAEDTMTAFIEGTKECENVVAELIRLATQVVPVEGVILPEGCIECRGRDFVRRSVTLRGVDYEASTRCDCSRGQALLAKDKARFAARDARDRTMGR